MNLLLDLKFIQPEIILIIASILVLMLDFMFKSKRLLAYFSLFSLFSALLVLGRGNPIGPQPVFRDVGQRPPGFVFTDTFGFYYGSGNFDFH